jgi:hypothetical protein
MAEILDNQKAWDAEAAKAHAVAENFAARMSQPIKHGGAEKIESMGAVPFMAGKSEAPIALQVEPETVNA